MIPPFLINLFWISSLFPYKKRTFLCSARARVAPLIPRLLEETDLFATAEEASSNK